MHHADDERQDHAAGIARDLVGEEDAADARETRPLRDVDGEEGMQEEAHDHRRPAEGDHERREALEAVHFPKQHADDDQHQSVARVAHAQGEEEHEEHGDERSRIEAVVFRPAVHVGQHLEHLDEPVVPEADRRPVLGAGGVLQVEDAGVVQRLRHGGVAFGGRVADQGEDGVLRRGNGRLPGQVSVQLGVCLLLPGFQFGETLLEGGDDALYLGLALEGFLKLGFRLSGAARRNGGLAGQVVFSGHHEVHAFLAAGNDLQGVVVLPLRLELLRRQDMEVQCDARVGEFPDQGRVEGPPVPQGIRFRAERRNFRLDVGIVHERAAREPLQVLLGVGDGLRPLREFDLADALDESLDEIDLAGQLGGSFVHGFLAAGDVHQAEGLEPFQQRAFLSVQENEGIFRHPVDHRAEASCSSSSA